MVTDKDTNIIYFSELLKSDPRFRKTFNQITDILDDHQVAYKFLPETKDIWARDYMPIQVSRDKFIEYRYDPDYLQGVEKERRDLKTYPDIVCDSIKLDTIKTDIILDGGNVIKASNSVILTDKIVEENKRTYNRKELIEKLKLLFEVEKVILIPWDKENDYFGHADGMIRFIKENKVILHKYYDFYPKEFKEKLFGALSNNSIDWVKLEYDIPKEDKRNWVYINYLQTKDLILLPKLGIDEDEQAFDQFKELFPEYANKDKIFQVNVCDILEKEGALNCISWTIKK